MLVGMRIGAARDRRVAQPLPHTAVTSVSASSAAGRVQVRIFGIDIDAVSGERMLAHINGLRSHGHGRIAFVNAHSLNLAYEVPEFRAALKRCHFLLNDGVGVELAARVRGGRFPENLNGTDFILRILTLAAEREWRVFLYGGRPGVAETASDALRRRISELTIAGTANGYVAADVAAEVKAAGADLVLVGLGQPLQELWLDANLDLTECTLGIGVGAFLDFAAGRVPRAPRWMSRCGVEWLFRLSCEPQRLWRRYLLGNPVFLWRAWRLRRCDHT
jgi:exopolysaccharide biosynthesis WecB/TagA/CpsF family protein